MERFSFRRFLNTLGGRLAGLALFVAVIALAGGAFGGWQMLRIRDAFVEMEEASSLVETALTVAHRTTELVLVVREEVSRG
ncbi:MAG: hypothetical protein ACK4WK_04360, partial [Anaerolineae bacterium]